MISANPYSTTPARLAILRSVAGLIGWQSIAYASCCAAFRILQLEGQKRPDLDARGDRF
ncbi:MAG: hypothetical protein GDA56_10665 [Hormoscilla sp. GM7CHS1pb]|nr:hypothetical protein [Hormoscilla sp. GM7CHS1pb]